MRPADAMSKRIVAIAQPNLAVADRPVGQPNPPMMLIDRTSEAGENVRGSAISPKKMVNRETSVHYNSSNQRSAVGTPRQSDTVGRESEWKGSGVVSEKRPFLCFSVLAETTPDPIGPK